MDRAINIAMTKWLILLISLMVITGCQPEKATEVPAGFSLKYTSGPTHADRGAHHFINITEVSVGYMLMKGENFRFFSKEDGSMKDTTNIEVQKKLTKEEVLSLYQLILDQNIMGMDERYRDPDIMDGDYKLFELSWKGAKKKISAVNVTPDELKKLHKQLKQLAVSIRK